MNLEILPMQLNDCAVKWSLNYSSRVAHCTLTTS